MSVIASFPATPDYTVSVAYSDTVFPEGTYTVRVTGPDGRRASVGGAFGTESAARDKANVVWTNLRSGLAKSAVWQGAFKRYCDNLGQYTESAPVTGADTRQDWVFVNASL